MPYWKRRVVGLVVALAVGAFDATAQAAVLTVNTTADNTTADATLTLREAILLINADGDSNAALGRALTGGEAAQVSGAYVVNDTSASPRR